MTKSDFTRLIAGANPEASIRIDAGLIFDIDIAGVAVSEDGSTVIIQVDDECIWSGKVR